jgi:tetratricopeptide (TPR) repeat protein
VERGRPVVANAVFHAAVEREVDRGGSRGEASLMRRSLVGLAMSVVLLTSAQCGRRSADKEQGPAIKLIRPDGRETTLQELQRSGASQTVRYEIEGDYEVSPEAEALHREGRAAGAAGEYEKALALFDRAAAASPRWPYPVYDKAFTYLLMKDAANARASYQKTVELAPRGFFTAITALDALTREERGELPQGTYLKFLSLEWVDSEAQKLKVLRELVEQVPAFAPAWGQLAKALSDDGERLAALDKGLAANPDAATRGELVINKAALLDRRGDRAGAVRMLKELIADPSITEAAATLAKASLASLEAK